ncbi:MAG: hypothetical protein JWR19_2167 [Pedosphaera sp.]|nr:hypothetical protein [Pedosphaera sp.]
MDRQNAQFRELLSLGGMHDDIAEAQIWSSDGGLQRTVKFKTDEAAQAEQEQKDKDNAAQAEAIKKSQEAGKPKAKTPAPIKAEGSKGEPVKTEPVKTEPVKTEPKKNENW